MDLGTWASSQESCYKPTIMFVGLFGTQHRDVPAVKSFWNTGINSPFEYT